MTTATATGYVVDCHCTEDVRLWGFSEVAEPPVVTLLFGEMVKRAVGVVQHYHGDLGHDFMWLQEVVTGTTEDKTFWWMPREWGTNIGQGAELIRDGELSWPEGGVLYKVEVANVDRSWHAYFTEYRRR
jgi:hypothetical protein